MSALVCGKRSQSTLFEDEFLSPLPSSKRIRCSAAFHFSQTTSAVSSPPPIDHLWSLFPDMDQELLERALEASGSNLEIAIKTLNNLHLESVQKELDFAVNKSVGGIEENIWPLSEGVLSLICTIILENIAGNVSHSVEDGISQNQPVANLPCSGSEWVELIVREMSNASNMNDAWSRASRVLEGLEKSIVARASAEAAQNFHKENVMLKEQVEKLLYESDIWKRAFKTLHGQKEEFDRCSQELQQWKLMMSQHDEQLSKLQIENYELKLRLVREQQSSPLPGRFHPDIFG